MVKKLYAFFLAGSPWQRLGVLLVLGVVSAVRARPEKPALQELVSEKK